MRKQPPSNRAPRFLHNMFQESIYLSTGDTWFDCLDEEFGDNHLWPGANLTRWKNMSKRERGQWLTGMLWNDTNIMPYIICTELELPQGSTYARAVRKLREECRHRSLSPYPIAA